MQHGSHAPTLTQKGASREQGHSNAPCRKPLLGMGKPRQKWWGFFVSCDMSVYPDIQLLERVALDIDDHTLLLMLLRDVAWRDEKITLFGKTMMQPRRIAWYGDSNARYTYSGIAHEPLPWIPLLQTLRGVVEDAAGTQFNSVLCNLYRNGQDSMGYHSDDEQELGECPTIASLSVGAVRSLHFRHRSNASVPTVKVALPSMSLLIMRGSTQQEWKHALPKTKRCDQPRVNLTFRLINC